MRMLNYTIGSAKRTSIAASGIYLTGKGLEAVIDVLPLRDKDMAAFFSLVGDIYPEGPIRSQLLLGEFGLFHPYFHPVLNHVEYALFLARDGKRPLGRVAAIIDSQYPDPEVGFFGLFEAQRNQEVAQKLILAAGDWLRDRGKTLMLGPLAFNTNQKVGALIYGFDHPPQPFLPFNPPYYAELFEGAGLQKEIDLMAYQWELTGEEPAKVGRVAQRARLRIPGLVIRQPKGDAILREKKLIGEVYNNSLTAGWGFVPLTEKELHAFLQGLASQRRGIVLIADTKTGPAGISISMPGTSNFRGRAATSFRLAIFGVIPQYQSKGLAAVLIHETLGAYTRSGCQQVEFSLVAENNERMNRLVAHSNATITKRYRVYRLSLN